MLGMLMGALVGAGPFWLLALVRTGERWPGRVGLVVALVVSGLAYRTPGAWALGLTLGVLLSFVALVILVGADWRLLPYVLLLFCAYYIAAGAALGCAYGLASLRTQVRKT